MIAPLRALAADADATAVDAMLLPVHPDHTTLAPIVQAGRMALGRLACDTAGEETPILAGLNVYAAPAARVAALIAWSAVAAEFDAGATDDAGKYWADIDAAHQVLRGLVPGLDEPTRAAFGDQLIDVAAELDDLERHRVAGTTPKYLACGGRTAWQAMEADVANRVEDRRRIAAWLAARWDGDTR